MVESWLRFYKRGCEVYKKFYHVSVLVDKIRFLIGQRSILESLWTRKTDGSWSILLQQNDKTFLETAYSLSWTRIAIHLDIVNDEKTFLIIHNHFVRDTKANSCKEKYGKMRVGYVCMILSSLLFEYNMQYAAYINFTIWNFFILRLFVLLALVFTN